MRGIFRIKHLRIRIYGLNNTVDSLKEIERNKYRKREQNLGREEKESEKGRVMAGKWERKERGAKKDRDRKHKERKEERKIEREKGERKKGRKDGEKKEME